MGEAILGWPSHCGENRICNRPRMKAYLGLYQAGKSMKEADLEKHYHFKWSVPAW
jgi:hypothetical protein